MTEPLIIEPSQPADSAVIWLHGLGADRFDFEPVARLLGQHLPSTRFILPQAPTRPVTFNMGHAMPSWYDILALDGSERAINPADLEASSETLIALINAQQQSGIDSKRIVLAGFSQGGAVVLHTALLRFDEKLAGVLALSTYAPTFNAETQFAESKQNLPVLCMHGSEDAVLPISMGRAVYDKLSEQGIKANWRDYPMGHEVRPEQLRDILDWLKNTLPSLP
ncbi:carboxylesterase [Ventosimonas gracilis]|uniref:Carboxylesterase n=1 Tax=Ventosimonas gracilis TaxID=1680762 RepID=A0A139SSC5_9GAMM|nr:alpha/beta fold hydrolase [Ventosimonas gracilis]KXU37468.1 carboxylesterase [Ventosimonas gracilis]